MARVDLSTDEARAKALEHEKYVERIRRDARAAVAAEPLPLGEVPKLTSYSLAELPSVRFEQRRALLVRGDMPIFNEGHLGEVYGLRGLGKTWFLQTLALVAATGIEALGFRNPNEALCRVLYVDGEMTGEDIQQRFERLCRVLAVPAAHMANLTIVGADWQQQFLPRLDTPEGQAALEPFVEQADLIIVDNRSCLFDPEGEKDPTAWQPAQDWLLSLRRRGKAVLLVHHSNRQGGARGHSKPEDIMNLLLKLTRPEDYSADEGARFVVEFDKARGAYGSAVASFIAKLTPDGWTSEPLEDAEDDTATTKLREYLLLADRAGDRPKSANAAIRAAHVNRNKGLEAWAAMRDSGEVVEHKDGGFYVKETAGAM